ncbi:MAG: hypothetical protein ACLUEQ_05110 [Cloacibacillus evryensis]
MKRELEEIIGINAEEAVPVSAKTGEGIPELLERIVRDVPAGRRGGAPLQALIFDSVPTTQGVICYVRVMNGTLAAGKNVRFMATGRDYQIDEVGVFKPDMLKVERLGPGEVGVLSAQA